MSVNESDLPLEALENSLFITRTLGLLGMIGAPLLLVETVLRMANILPQNGDNAWVGLIEIFYVGGWMATAIGMRRLRATGNGASAKILYAVQIFGLTMAFLFTVQVFFGASIEKSDATLFFKITDIFFPFSHLLMIVIGVFVVRARVFRGWFRVAPILVGIVLALFMFGIGSIFDIPQSAIAFPLSTAIGLFSLAFAVSRNSSSSCCSRVPEKQFDALSTSGSKGGVKMN